MKTSNIIFALLLSSCFTFANPVYPELIDCSSPTNLTLTNLTDSSVSFDWDDCGCSEIEYRVFFVKDGQTSNEYSTSSSNFSIGGLTHGLYQFHFYTICGGTTSEVIIVEEVMIL